MHNSQLLNSISGHQERVYITLTAYVQIENCTQPATISKDLCVVIHSRDSKSTTAGYVNAFHENAANTLAAARNSN